MALLCNHKKAESKNLKDQLDKISDKIKEKKAEKKKLASSLKDIKAGASDAASTTAAS